MTIMWAFMELGISLFAVMAAELRIRDCEYGCDRAASPKALMQHLHTTIALVLHSCTDSGLAKTQFCLVLFFKVNVRRSPGELSTGPLGTTTGSFAF
jgi:hypothetical protein